jgi:hypothetical protein
MLGCPFPKFQISLLGSLYAQAIRASVQKCTGKWSKLHRRRGGLSLMPWERGQGYSLEADWRLYPEAIIGSLCGNETYRSSRESAAALGDRKAKGERGESWERSA